MTCDLREERQVSWRRWEGEGRRATDGADGTDLSEEETERLVGDRRRQVAHIEVGRLFHHEKKERGTCSDREGAEGKGEGMDLRVTGVVRSSSVARVLPGFQ